MDAWDELVKIAVIGTERQSPKGVDAPGAAGELLRRLDGSDRESAFLTSTGVLAVCRRAGFVPAAGSEALPDPAMADDVPACGSAAADRLGRMLAGEHRELLPEWLDALAQARKRAPHRSLPELLELGRTTANLRPLIEPVLGLRGQWLMARNPDWQWSAPSDDESAWQTGSRDARISLLRRLRQSNAARARELLAGTWSQEPPEDRAAFISVLQIGLGPEDEPFLESALDDRRKEVRKTAAALLTQIAGSQLVSRMRERIKPLMSISASRRGARIDLTLPAAPDKGLERDSAGPVGAGEKAWSLRQMLAAVPPAEWTQSGAMPSDLIRAALKHEWKDALLEGWAQAAVNHRDSAWAEALLSGWILELGVDDVVGQGDAAESLMGVLQPESRERVLTPLLLKVRGPIHHGPLIVLLRAARHRWSATFTRLVADALRSQIARYSDGQDYNLRAIVPELGRYMEPDSVAALSSGWPDQSAAWAHWNSTIDQLLSTVQFRHDMLKEIRQ